MAGEVFDEGEVRVDLDLSGIPSQLDDLAADVEGAFGGTASRWVTRSLGCAGLGDKLGDSLAGAASGLANSIGGALSGVASTLGNALQSTLEGVGIAAGGALATSLVGGYQRYTAIEDATAALTVSLGNATEAAGLLDEVMGVVTGTPYDFQNFADAAQRMVSFGVEAEKVPTYLEAIGETAATKGGRANEFAQRLATNFGQIAAMGKITGAEIREMAIAGVPALQILANEFGVSAEEMQKMVSDGAVPATEAMDALAKGILEGTDGIAGATPALAGTMEGLREQLSGALSGVSSASDRFGAKIVEGFAPAMTVGANALSGFIDAMSRAVSPIISDFVEMEWIQDIIDMVDDLDASAFDSVIDKISQFSDVLIPLGALAGASGISALSGVLGPFAALLGPFGTALGPVIAGIGGLVAVSEPLQDSLSGLWENFQDLTFSTGDLYDGLDDVVQSLGSGLAAVIDEVGPPLVDFVSEVGALVIEALPLIGDLAEGLGTVLGGALGGILPVLTSVVGLFSGLGGSMEGVGPVAQPLADSLIRIGEALASAVSAMQPDCRRVHFDGRGDGRRPGRTHRGRRRGVRDAVRARQHQGERRTDRGDTRRVREDLRWDR